MDQAARCVVFGVPSADHLYVRAVVGPKGMVHIHGLAHLANHEVLVFRTSLAEGSHTLSPLISLSSFHRDN